MKHSEFYLRMELLQNTLIAHATQDEYDTGDYNELRDELISHRDLEHLIPEFVVTCRTLAQFWGFIKHRFAHYAERRQFIWASFTPLLNYLEQNGSTPSDAVAAISIDKVGQEFITREWNKCLERRSTDPEAAITSARSLLETTLKYVLDETDVEYRTEDDLPSLYKKAAKRLNLSPEQHNEEVFKQILGGALTIVNGFASLRNKYGDAHGKTRKYVRPSERHAQLAVNLAGTIATFLFETLDIVRSKEANPN